MKNDRPRVLIVDDVPSNVQVLHQILKEKYAVSFATSGQKAIQLAGSLLPDIVLLDIKMPDLNGYEVCRRLKAEPLTKDIPIIFITALQETHDETAGFEAGGVDFITKPVSAPIVQARVATHVELKQQRDFLRSLSYRDGLTNIANRRHFDEQLRHNWSRAGRTQAPLSLLLFDVDFFKQYNDLYGHQAGDLCLQSIAAILEDEMKRTDDLTARTGGEEFCCLLPHTDHEGAVAVAQRIALRVREKGIEHQGSEVADVVTVSGGVVTSVVATESSPEEFYEAADKALYAAKRAGRDQVCSYRQGTS